MDHPGLIRVMVVDDDPNDLERIARLLLGVVGDGDLPAFALANAGSRDEALQAWQGGLQVDVCLIDWRLDQGDGLELANRLQAAGCTAPMVFLTWHADPGFDRAAMRAGAEDFLPKAEASASSLARTLRHAVERHRLGTALRRREAQFRALADNFPHGGVLMLSEQGGIRDAYGPGLGPLGLAGMVGRTLTEALPACAASAIRDLLAAEETGPIELMLRDRVVQAAVARPATGADVMLVLQDRTTLARLQQTSIAQGQVAAAGLFASGVAHEWASLHTIVTGAVEAALRTNDDPATRRHLDQALAACLQAGVLTRSLLAWAGGRDPGTSPTDLDAVVRSIVAIVAGTLAGSGITLTVLEGKVPALPLQAQAVGQVLLTLLMNARQALAGRRTGTIEVATTVVGDRVVLSVSDNGPGLPAEMLGTLSAPAPAGRSGAGLGLAVCRVVAAAHGGVLTATNRPGGGAYVALELPLTGHAS